MNKQYKKILLLTGIGLIISYIVKAGKNKTKMNTLKFSKFKANEIILLSMIEQALIDAGLSGDILNFALAQLLFETGKFTAKSQVYVLNTNYSGIKYICKSYQKATRGSDVPIKERIKPPSACLNFYAKFASVKDWAIDLKRIYSFGAKPINATNIEDFVARLKKNRYFDSDLKSYTTGTKKYYNMLVL